MGFLYDDDKDEDPVHRAFGHPLGTDPDDPERAKQAVDWIGRGISVASPFIEPIAKELGPEALETGKSVGRYLGPLGVAISAGSFLYDCGKTGYDLADDQNKGIDPYHDQKIYNDMAGVTSNGIHTVLGGASLVPTPAAPFLMAADALLTTGEVLTDLTGKGAGALFGEKAAFDASSVEGGLLRYAEGDKSIGNTANNWVTDKLGGGTLAKLAGTLAGGAVNNNPLGWMWNTNNAVKDGVQSEIQAAQDGYNNGEGLMGMGKKAGLNPMGLPDGNPLLMALGLGGGKQQRVSAGMGGGISSALRAAPAEGVGGGPKRPQHHLTAHMGGSISPLLVGAREGGGRAR